MIEVDGLVKTYGSVRAVQDLSFAVREGEILGLVGPNGAGKTTTLRCMTGIIPPTAGRVRVAGFDLLEQPLEAKRRMAFVPDEPRLFDYLTTWDHLTITARLYNIVDGAERAKLLLEEFELGDRREAFPSELSRGMKQKLMVAMALLHRPKAILLDEPLTGLDPGAMRRMKTRIRDTAREGVAVILSSHMLHLVEELCERVVVVVRGKKVLDGTLEEIRRASPGLAGDADLEAIFMKAVEGDSGMIAVLARLQWMTLKGRVIRSLRLLRQPKYLIGSIVGFGWMAMWVLRPILHSRVSVARVPWGRFDAALPSTMHRIAALVVSVGLPLPWLLASGRLGLPFREAELTMLLQAPLTRRQVIQYGLLKSELGVVISALALSLVLGGGAGPFAWLAAFLGTWLLLELWHLNGKWRGLFHLRQREVPAARSRSRRLLLTIALLAFYAVLFAGVLSFASQIVAAMRGSDFEQVVNNLTALEWPRRLTVVLTPAWWLTAPIFADSAGMFVLAAVPLLLAVIAQRELVLRSKARFEESALEQAKSQESRKSPARRFTRVSSRARTRHPFALEPSGPPEVALLWKNAIRLARTPWRTTAIGGLMALVALAVLPAFLRLPDLTYGVLGTLGAVLMVMLPILGGMAWNNDLRTDLAHLEMLRTWPVSAQRLVLAEVVSPALCSFAAATFGAGMVLASIIGVGLRQAATGTSVRIALLPRSGSILGVDNRLAALVIFASFLPMAAAGSFLSSALQNLAALFAPAWVAHSADRSQGVGAFGQRMIFSSALALAFGLALIPSALLVGAAALVQHLLGVPWSVWAFPLWGALAALPLFIGGWLIVQAAAQLWRRLDPSEEILEIGR